MPRRVLELNMLLQPNEIKMGKDIESILKKALKKSSKETNSKVSDEVVVSPLQLIDKKTPKDRTGYDKIKKTNFFNIKEDINEWSNRDFALYISKKFSEKYKEFWDVRIVGVTMYIGRIKESLFEEIGFCDNITLKKYIDFFFENEIDGSMKRAEGKFYINSLRYRTAISDFLDVYQYSPTIDDKQKVQSRKDIAQDDMDKAYLLSDESMVFKYGLVLSISYLIKIKSFNEEKAIKKISKAVEKIKKKNVIEEMINKTIEFSPYPDDMYFSDIDKVCDILEKESIGSNLFVKDCDRYEFLRNV